MRFGAIAELDSRVEIEYETYAKEINIEAKAMIDIAGKQIIPAVIKYTTELATSAAAVKSVCDADISVQTELLAEVSDLLSETKVALAKLEEVTEKGGTMEEGRDQAGTTPGSTVIFDGSLSESGRTAGRDKR